MLGRFLERFVMDSLSKIKVVPHNDKLFTMLFRNIFDDVLNGVSSWENVKDSGRTDGSMVRNGGRIANNSTVNWD